jgi:hypothetical protein
MAIPGKFEIAQDRWCGTCRRRQKFTARSLEWTGDLRTELACTTPGCTAVFEKRGAAGRLTKGNLSSHPAVYLLTRPDGDQVVLEDYDCSEPEAAHFCKLFRDVLRRSPSAASEAILAHWQTGGGSPHVWLLKSSREWGGNGWAASSTDGLSLYMVSTLVGQIPDQHIRTTIAHEFGHSLFVAGNEPNHVPAAPSLESMSTPAPADPLSKFRQEWLVWRLMVAWGFDQRAMEEWMERNVIQDADGIRMREHPLGNAEFEGKCIAARKRAEEQLSDMTFPAEFEHYLKT